MAIRFRPVRGGLKEALTEVKSFDTLDQMFAYIQSYVNECFDFTHFDATDIFITGQSVSDIRTGWKDTRYVFVKDKNGSVFPVGYCATEFM